MDMQHMQTGIPKSSGGAEETNKREAPQVKNIWEKEENLNEPGGMQSPTWQGNIMELLICVNVAYFIDKI